MRAFNRVEEDGGAVVKLQWRGWRVEECRVTCAPPLPQGRAAVTTLTPDHHH